MLNTLRGRLILSHALPLVVIVPLMGLALVYVLETQVLLPSLSQELTGQAKLVAVQAGDAPQIWTDPSAGRDFVARVNGLLSVRLRLIDRSGLVIAASDPADAERAGRRVAPADLPLVLSGQVVARTAYSRNLHTEVAFVLAPVVGPDGSVVGAVRLSQSLDTVLERFMRLRYLTAAVLGLGLLLGAAVGWLLALSLARVLQQVSSTVDRLTRGEVPEPLPMGGPEEVRGLLLTVNGFAERVRTLETARRQLLANLVHELGRPLGGLRSAIQALQRGAAQDPALQQELLAGMDGEISRLRRLLDDLPQMHGQLVGGLEIARRSIPVGSWLAGVLPTYRQAAIEKGLRWVADIPGDLPVIEGDADRLGQALGNLLSNAIKYTPPGGLVCLAAGTQERELWIRVSDTGPGIAPAEQALIFAPFYRSPRDHRFPQGVGLGLSIARDLTIAHGGRLELASTSSAGSTFTMWLPLGSPVVPAAQP